MHWLEFGWVFSRFGQWQGGIISLCIIGPPHPPIPNSCILVCLVSDSGAYQRWILALGSTNNKQGGPPREGTGFSLPWLDAGILKGMEQHIAHEMECGNKIHTYIHTYIIPILTCKWNEIFAGRRYMGPQWPSTLSSICHGG